MKTAYKYINKNNDFKHFLVKAISYIFLSIMVINLISCDSGVVLYSKNLHETEDIVKIELITYNSDENDIYNELQIFDSDLMSVDSILNNEDIPSFISDLTSIHGFGGKYKHVINRPYGQGILITYIDGSFTIITYSTVNDQDVLYIGEFKNDFNLDFYHSYIWSEGAQLFSGLLFDYFEYTA